LHQLADIRFQKLVRYDHRFERASHVTAAGRDGLVCCRVKTVGVGRGLWRGGDMIGSNLTGRLGCSDSVLMKSSDHKRRFPPPWRVEQAGADCYEVRDANGFPLASVH
jgi:hypothetical protein